jgi:uncharacterized protein involved in exopolysaccharide biosynthesis
VSEVELADTDGVIRASGATAGEPHSNGARPPEESSLFGFLNVLLKYRFTIALVILFGGVLSASLALLAPRTYTANASFTPRSSRAVSQMTTLASLFGMTLNLGGDVTQSGSFYGDLLLSPTILRTVATNTYSVRTPDGKVVRGDLADIYGIKGNRPSARAEAVRRLKRNVRPAASPRSGVVYVYVKSRYPELSLQLVRNILAAVDAYNLDRQRRIASAERDFVEKRLVEAQSALRQSEDELQRFREFNRAYRSSPQLAFENWRRDREVVMRQLFFTSLASNYEQARIDAVRDLPATVIVESPELPIAPDRRAALRKALLGAIAGLFAGIVLAFVRQRLDENRRAGTPAFREYQELKRDAARDLSRPWQPVGRMLKPSSKA